MEERKRGANRIDLKKYTRLLPCAVEGARWRALFGAAKYNRSEAYPDAKSDMNTSGNAIAWGNKATEWVVLALLAIQTKNRERMQKKHGQKLQ